jgi:superfamily II DNA/RNA helicase
MESKQPQEEQKHTELKEDDKEDNEVVLTVNKFIANIASPYIKKKVSWADDEEEKKEEESKFNIPQDIRVNIEDGLKFLKPSGIQAVGIPMIINEPYHDFIAQAKNGSGKTGCFSIGSILRIDRKIEKI